MGHAIPVNVKDLTTALQLALQLAPSILWSNALHVSGLFAYIVDGLKDTKDSKVRDTTRVEPEWVVLIMCSNSFLQTF